MSLKGFLCARVDCKSIFWFSTKVGRVKEGWKQSLSDIVPGQVKNKYPSNKKKKTRLKKLEECCSCAGQSEYSTDQK